MKLKQLLFTTVFLITAPLASAALISSDFASAGDGLLTKDTDTGLEWLDLTQTTSTSFNEVLAGAGGWLTVHGFRYGTGAEINSVIDRSGADTASRVLNMLHFFGCTIACGSSEPGARGIYAEASGFLSEIVWFKGYGFEGDPFVPGPNGAESTTGHFLVRGYSVDEPSLKFLTPLVIVSLLLRLRKPAQL